MPNLEIIFENKDYIVVNKPAGLISEKSPYEDTTVESLVYNYLLSQKPKPYVGVIHRLDRVTSGVLIFAKKKSILVKFNALFSQRQIQKTYYAIVENKPKRDKAVLNHYLLKNQKDKIAEISPTKNKNAVACSLSYTVMAENEFGYLLKVQPKTGRFHQIRAQLSFIGSPIVGDEKYGSKQTYFPLSIALHAQKLAFTDFNTGSFLTYEAAFPNNKYWKF